LHAILRDTSTFLLFVYNGANSALIRNILTDKRAQEMKPLGLPVFVVFCPSTELIRWGKDQEMEYRQAQTDSELDGSALN
jgi:hypothetical protein